jgi:uncharacterized protein with FMN-binding domain
MNNFNKIVLSFFVIALFVFYVAYQQQNSSLPAVVPIANVVSKNSGQVADNTVNIPVASSVPAVQKKNNDEASVPVASVPVVKAPVASKPPATVVNPVVSAPSAPVPVTPVPSVPVASVPAITGKFKDGVYTGDAASAYYEDIQVQAVIKGGQLVDVVFLNTSQMRNRSIEINSYAFPALKSEAIQAQSAQVDTVSGATDTSGAFVTSLSSALAQAS